MSKDNLINFFGVARDINERKKIEERLLYMASIVESSDDAIIGKTLDGLVVTWNKGAENLYGYTAAEMMGKSIAVLFPSGKADELSQILEKLKRGEKIEHYQTKRRKKNGEIIDVSVTISPIITSDNKIIGAASIAQDISREKELDRIKDEFVSLSSHALRTPMSAIKGLVSMIFQGDYGPVNENLKKPLANISISTERLIDLVNDLLNISRLQTGKVVFRLSQFPLERAIEKVVGQLTPFAQENKIELQIQPAKSAEVQADIEKTEEILDNLISNAIKYTNKGSVEISLVDKEDRVIVFVKDTGIGIAEKDRPKLFQRFQQITNPIKKQISGTGLGLYISKIFAQKMGGDAWLSESKPEVGSTFAFSLPKVGSILAKDVAKIINIKYD